MLLRFKVSGFLPLASISLVLIIIGAAFQTVTIVIPPSRVLLVPLPVFAALPAAVLVGYIGANEPKILARTAVRNLSLRRLLEQCLATVIIICTALLVANLQPQGNLIAGLRDFIGLWGLAGVARAIMPAKSAWFLPFALFATSVVAGTNGQSIAWWAWLVAPNDNQSALAAAGIAAVIGAIAVAADPTRPKH